MENLGQVVERAESGESLFLQVKVDSSILPFVWKKGSLTVNGTSLTVNEVSGNVVSICLIPETLKRTNLAFMAPGDFVTIEPDYIARATVRSMELKK